MNKIAECCCGQLSVELTGEPEIFGICHCNNCKKRTGSAFGISAYFSKSNVVKKNGDSNCYSLHNTEQDHDQQRFFCTICGTTLFWLVSSSPELMGVAGGCFIETPLGEPKFSAAHANICEWLSLSESIQKNA